MSARVNIAKILAEEISGNGASHVAVLLGVSDKVIALVREAMTSPEALHEAEEAVYWARVQAHAGPSAVRAALDAVFGEEEIDRG